jgi:hypothetical protein
MAGVLVLLCVSLTGVANAGSLSDARIALRVGPSIPSTKACLPANTGVATDCVDWEPQDVATGISYYYLTVGQAATGVGGISFGVEYTGLLFVNFINCTDGIPFTNNGFPASGGGNRLTWTTCPQAGSDDPAISNMQATVPSGIQVCFGAFYIYKYGQNMTFDISPNHLDSGDELAVGDCGAAVSFLSPLAGAKVGIGTAQGYNPCGAIATEPTTWGKLKSRFDGE